MSVSPPKTVRPPTQEELTRWRLSREREIQRREKKYRSEDEVIDLILSGMSRKQAADYLNISQTRVSQRYNSALKRLSRLSKLPIGVVLAFLYPREKGKQSANGRGPYSTESATLSALAGLHKWSTQARDVSASQQQSIGDELFYDVRAWLAARRNRENFKIAFTLPAHEMAWNLSVVDKQEWSGRLRDLAKRWQIPRKIYERKKAFISKVLEPVKKELYEFGDFDMSWRCTVSKGQNLIDLYFTPKS